MASAAAKRYARAVFELAQEERAVPRWRDRLGGIAELLELPALRAALLNRGVATEAREQLLRDVAGERFEPEALNLALLLLENGRVADASDLVEEFDRLTDETEGRVRATAITAVELGEDEKRTLERELAQRFGGQVRLETQVDPEILGGLVVRVGDHLVDASVRTRLQQLRRRLATAGT